MAEKEKYYERYETQKGTYICAKCNIPLEPGKVILQYMGNDFPVELPKCPKCGQALIPEELALGKILQVERALEDK